MSALGDRIRGIVGTRIEPFDGAQGNQARPSPDVASVLGGEWRADAHGTCLVVERRVDAAAAHGRARVGDFAATIRDAAAAAPLLAGGVPVQAPFIFFDLETTGLSGGAGTHAFLVGCGWFDDEDGFVTRQYVMTRFADERALLGTVAGALARAGALVSFNGKSFDAPVLETRYLFHRLEWVGAQLPHLDMLHPARAFWGSACGHASGREREGRSGREASASGRNDVTSCSLSALEQRLLGARRTGDVPGFEIPERYFQFVRSGDARPLAAVLEHNRLDLLSLAGLAARLLHLVREGPIAAQDPREALALGRVYARAGLHERAHDAYECVAGAADAGAIATDALRALACLSRRARRYAAAADYWRRLLALRGCPPSMAREASEALAIHHEHRVRDFAEAKRFALQSLENGMHTGWAEAGRYRLARIERKLASRQSSATSRQSASSLDWGLTTGD